MKRRPENSCTSPTCGKRAANWLRQVVPRLFNAVCELTSAVPQFVGFVTSTTNPATAWWMSIVATP